MKARSLLWLRRVSQAVFLALFLFLLLESRLPQDVYVNYSEVLSGEADLRLDQPVTFFFQLDPLVWLTSWLAGQELIRGFGWALAVLGLTLLLGRVFCSFICPLGTLNHLAGACRPALRGQAAVAAGEKRPSQRVKYFVLIALLVGAFLGLNLSGLLDPIAFAFRSLALAVFPGFGAGLRGVFQAMAESDSQPLNLLSYGAEILVAPVFGYEHRAYLTGWLIGALFLVVLFLNRVRPRFWCRVLCPLGALLGICSRFSLLRLEKDPERCTGCGRCTRALPGRRHPGAGKAVGEGGMPGVLQLLGRVPGRGAGL